MALIYHIIADTTGKLHPERSLSQNGHKKKNMTDSCVHKSNSFYSSQSVSGGYNHADNLKIYEYVF